MGPPCAASRHVGDAPLPATSVCARHTARNVLGRGPVGTRRALLLPDLMDCAAQAVLSALPFAQDYPLPCVLDRHSQADLWTGMRDMPDVGLHTSRRSQSRGRRRHARPEPSATAAALRALLGA